MTAPTLEGDALAAVEHRGSHLQIIAAAGSGKTEVVAQRVAHLLSNEVPARGIVAFTFTERAADELKSRIIRRVEDRLGKAALDLVGGLFVGTIHSYCFRLLQQHVPRYETYDVLDDNQLTAFLAREGARIGIRQFDATGRERLFASIERFIKSVDVVENELLDPASMPEPFRSVLLDYLSALERYRLLTFGQQIVRAVEELERPETAGAVHRDLRHLIVDEYQDINPAQERLIELLVAPHVELCVVGDDDQAIYQWRGSDVSNIVDFRSRYELRNREVASYSIATNRRSRPQIVDRANRFAAPIPERLPKTMASHRAAGDSPEIGVWAAPTELEEAGWIAHLILEFNDAGLPFRDMAVLVRTSAAYPRLVEQFATFGIPVQPGGRTGLFEQAEAIVLGKAIAWLTNLEWGTGYDTRAAVDEHDLVREFEVVFGLGPRRRQYIARFLQKWRDAVPNTSRRADLVGELYELLTELDVRQWDLRDTRQVNRLGTLARFSMLLADYESVRRRARPDADNIGEQVGGEDRGTWYYRNLGLHIINYASGAYEDFDGEADFDLDAVDLTTVHRAKGLEWPVVFVPSLTSNRFPTSKSGQIQPWLVPREDFAAARYEGSDADERRLFYVAITRARDWLSLSRHERVRVKAAAASPYWREHSDLLVDPASISPPTFEPTGTGDDDPISLTYSEMAAYLSCPQAFRLRNLLGFQPRFAPEIGYGKAVHHVLRVVADRTRETGVVPDHDEIDNILDTSFFLPTANKPAHQQLKEAARRLVSEYATAHSDDLFRIWESERPFELHLDGVSIAGRADVILDREGGVDAALAILDYKTSTSAAADHDLQLQVYVDAGRREGLDVRAAYVHDLRAGARGNVAVDPDAIAAAETTVSDAARRLRARRYEPTPGLSCRRCEVRSVCNSAAP